MVDIQYEQAYDAWVSEQLTRLCTERAHRHVGPPGMQIPTDNALCQGTIKPDGTCPSAFRHVRREEQR